MKYSQNIFIYSFLPALFLSLIYIQLFNNPINLISILLVIVYFIALIILYYFLFKNHAKLKLSNIFLHTLFFIYIIQLVYLLFLSPQYLRDHKEIIDESYKYTLNYRFNYETNLIPFQTIKRMLSLCYYDQYQVFAYVNLLGNLIAFVPFSFFLPLLYPKQRKGIYFILTLACIIIVVEILQFFTLSGSMDIDDFILNFFGALLFYYPIKTTIQYILK